LSQNLLSSKRDQVQEHILEILGTSLKCFRTKFKIEKLTNESYFLSMIHHTELIASNECNNNEVIVGIKLFFNGKLECDIAGRLLANLESMRSVYPTFLQFGLNNQSQLKHFTDKLNEMSNDQYIQL